MSDLELNSRQTRFADYYLTEPSATRAAIMAGYSRKSAAVQAHNLLRNPAVVARVMAMRREEKLRYRPTKDDAHDWYEAAKHAAFAEGNWREVRLLQDRQCQLDNILPQGGGARRFGQAEVNNVADMVADAMLAKGAPMQAIKDMSWDGVRRVRDEKLRREAREARIAEHEKKVRKRMDDHKLSFDLAAFEPTKDEIERDAEEKAELDAFAAQPGATVRVARPEPLPPPPVEAPWVAPPLPDDAEERMAEIISASPIPSSPSPSMGEGRGEGERVDVTPPASPSPLAALAPSPIEGEGEESDAEETAANDRKPEETIRNYNETGLDFAPAQANGAPVDAGAPLNETSRTP